MTACSLSPRGRGAIAKVQAIAVAVVIVIAAAGGLLYYYYSSSSSAAPKTPIKIGFTVSLTGAYASGGKEVFDGYETWAKAVNNSGGIDGRPVQLVYYDDESDPTLAASLYTKLITVDGVSYTFGPFSSPITATTSTVTEQNHIIMLDSLGWSSSIFSRGYNYVFLVSNAAAENVSISYINWIKTLPAAQQPKTYAIAIASDVVSGALAKGFQQLANSTGMTLVDKEVFSGTATDLTDVFLKVKAANPDVVLVSSISNPSLILAVQTMHQLNLTPKIVFGLDSMGLPEIHKALGPLMENMMFDEIWSPSMTYPGSANFSSIYKSIYGVYPETHAAIAYACGQVLQQAIVGSGSFNSTAVRNYIVSHTFNTIYGPISFKQNGSPQHPADILAQWQNEKMQFVYPPSGANATAVYPFKWGA